MKILKFEYRGRVCFGVLKPQDQVTVLESSPFEGAIKESFEILPLEGLTLLAPTVEHPRIFGVGFNYKAHILETGRSLPEIPPLFMKPDTSLIGSSGKIVYPRVGKIVHYETELVAVIGRRAKSVSKTDALQYVLGYTCGNDVSERTYQRKEMAMGLMTVGKAFDTFAPTGPWIETELDPSNLRMRGRLNGKVVQECDTSDLLFGVDALVEYLSTFITLMPGDLIFTGTPGGVGPMQVGDRFEIEVDEIGTLTNEVVAE